MLGTPKSVIWLLEVSWARREIATRDMATASEGVLK